MADIAKLVDELSALTVLEAADLVKQGAKLLVTFGNQGVLAAQAATKTVPIIGMADDLAGKTEVDA